MTTTRTGCTCCAKKKSESGINSAKKRVHMKYFFDSQVGFFETLDGNAMRGASEEREGSQRDGTRRRKRNRSRAVEAEEGRIFVPQTPKALLGCVTPPELGSTPVATPQFMVPTETGFRQHRGPTITIPSMSTPRSADNLLDLTAEDPSSDAKGVNTVTAGWPVLCTAAQQGNMESVRQLLEAKPIGADPNIPNCLGAHPLFYALCHWRIRMFRLLVKHGADIGRARSEKKESLKDYAERKVKQAAQLKRFGAAYFASPSRLELLQAVGARGAARAARKAAAAAESSRAKRRRVNGGGSISVPSRMSACLDPYGGSGSIDLTADGDAEQLLQAGTLRAEADEGMDGVEGDSTKEAIEEGDAPEMEDNELAALLGEALREDDEEHVDSAADALGQYPEQDGSKGVEEPEPLPTETPT
ncbi:unnamed protein product [Durusdinium trenchii]|uniref:Uncharacterized protein n=1 Tax=Durusdinium trenchii TaxID=1381693 RepID=A0ABP0SH29_9DINO